MEKFHNRILRVLVSIELDTQNEDFLLPLRISETLAVKDGKRGTVIAFGLVGNPPWARAAVVGSLQRGFSYGRLD